jgi:cell division protease FtsH
VNQTIKTITFWVVICFAAMLLWQIVRSNRTDQQAPYISYSQFLSGVEAGTVSSVRISGTLIQGEYDAGKGHFRVNGPNDPAIFLPTLREKGVEIWFADAPQGSLPLQLLGTWAPLVLLGALWFYMIRQMRKKGSMFKGTGGPQSPSGWGSTPSTPVT